MPTPDEVYEQVLKEETDKGSSPAVAQARAKAAGRSPTRFGHAQHAAKLGGGPGPRRAPAPAAAAPAPTRLRKPNPPPRRPSGGQGLARPRRQAAKKAVGNGNGAAVPERVQRLLAVVKPEAIQKVERQPMDRVNVWPHLMAAEFVSLLVVMAMITLFSVAVGRLCASSRTSSQTPNPSRCRGTSWACRSSFVTSIPNRRE